MKKILSVIITVMFLMMLSLSAEAFENEIVKIEIPEVFSSLTENDIEGTTVKQWTAPEDNSNVSVNIIENDGTSYVDMSDTEKAVFHNAVIAQMNREVGEVLKGYSIGFEISNSACNDVEFNGIKGIGILFDSVYSYEDGSTLEAKNYMYVFSSENSMVTISATINDENKLALIDEMMNSFEFKEEVLVNSDDGFETDGYNVVKYAVIGACAGGAAGLILTMIKKKKKQKETEPMYVPITPDESKVEDSTNSSLKGE